MWACISRGLLVTRVKTIWRTNKSIKMKETNKPKKKRERFFVQVKEEINKVSCLMELKGKAKSRSVVPAGPRARESPEGFVMLM